MKDAYRVNFKFYVTNSCGINESVVSFTADSALMFAIDKLKFVYNYNVNNKKMNKNLQILIDTLTGSSSVRKTLAEKLNNEHAIVTICTSSRFRYTISIEITPIHISPVFKDTYSSMDNNADKLCVVNILNGQFHIDTHSIPKKL